MFLSKRLLPWLVLAVALRAHAAVLPPEKLLPKDTLFVATAPDWNKAEQFWSNNPYSGLWREPSLKPFKSKFMENFTTGLVHPLEQSWGVKFSDFAGLLQGQVTFALVPVTPKSKTDNRLAGLLLIDTKDHAGQLKTNLAQVLKKWVDAGRSIKSQKIRETDFTTMFTSSDDLSLKKLFPNVATAPADSDDDTPKVAPKNIGLTVGQVDSLLVVSDSDELIEKVLSRQSGGMVPSLEESPAFQSDFGARLRESPFYFWVNGKGVVDLLSKPPGGANEESPAEGFHLDTILAATGVANLTSLSLSYHNYAEGACAQFFMSFPEDKRPAVLKILSAEAKDSSPPPFVPADAAGFWRWRLNLAHSWTALEAMLNDMLPPQIMAQLNMVFAMAGKDKDEHYDLKAELLNNLGDDIISYARTSKGNTLADMKDPPTLYLLGSPNPDKLAGALKVMLAIPFAGTPITDREFLGRKIYTVGAALPGKAAGGSICFCASGSYLAISGDSSMLEEYLRSNDSKIKSLLDAPGLAEAAQKVGGMGAGLFGYENENLTSRPLFDVFRKQNLSAQDILGMPIPSPYGDYIEAVRQWADFSLLPPFDVIAKYFNYSVYAGGFSADGFALKIYSPTPPALRH